MTELPMHVAHLSPVAGAFAGLRVVDAAMAVGIVASYAHVLRRMVRRGFAAGGSDVTGGGLVFIAFGVVLFMVYGVYLVVTKGAVPADEFALTRIALGTAFVSFNIGFTILFAGMTTRAWLLKGLSLAEAARHGKTMYLRLASITGLSMGVGAALAAVVGR